MANLIGILCARFEIGSYKGREGSISYSIVDSKNETLNMNRIDKSILEAEQEVSNGANNANTFSLAKSKIF